MKTGSRGYASRTGSIDLLGCLGIPLTVSYQQTGELLGRYNIACAGYFVYPIELAALARAVAPLRMRTLGRFLNTVGPFLAAVPVSVQLTGVSEHTHLATLRYLATQQAPKRVWLCTNNLRVDELISVTENLVHDVGAGQFQVRPGALALGGGTLSDLRAAAEGADGRLLPGVLGGKGPPAAIASVCLNAAALAVAAGTVADWVSAVRMAREALDGGAAVELVRRMRRDRDQAGAPRSGRPCPGHLGGALPVISRIGSAVATGFFSQRRPGQVGLALFLNAGDPPLGIFRDIVQMLDELRVDCLELAVPFPDSCTDGPIIRRSADRALRTGVGLDAALGALHTVHDDLSHLRIALLVDWSHTIKPASMPDFSPGLPVAPQTRCWYTACRPGCVPATTRPLASTSYRSSPPAMPAPASRCKRKRPPTPPHTSTWSRITAAAAPDLRPDSVS